MRIILDRFEEAHTRRATGWKKGRVHKIILYGSHARGDWVFEPHTTKGYCSDFDLMVIVNHKQVAEHADFWHGLRAEFDRMLADRKLKTKVGIVHSPAGGSPLAVAGALFLRWGRPRRYHSLSRRRQAAAQTSSADATIEASAGPGIFRRMV